MSLTQLAALARQLKSSDPADRAAQARHLEYVCELSEFLRAEGTPELSSCLLAAAHALEALAGSDDEFDREGVHRVVRKLIQVVGTSMTRRLAPGDAPPPDGPPGEKTTLGHMLLKLGQIDRDQLAKALRTQRSNRLPLGECLLLLGMCPPDRLLEALKLQRRMRSPELGSDAPAPPDSAAAAANGSPADSASYVVTKDMFLGEVLLGADMITNEQLEQAMHMHHLEGLRVGEALVKLGALTEEDVEKGLALQKSLQGIASSFARSPVKAAPADYSDASSSSQAST